MLVVADSSPVIALINTKYVHILAELFQQVVVPPQVAAELQSPRRALAVREFIAKPPSWLSIKEPTSVQRIPAIHAGEQEAISLAQELRADLLLIDDVAGRKAAMGRGVRVTGTVGVLERAADRGLLDLESAFEKLKRTDFWISERILDTRLELHRTRRRHFEKER